MRNRLRNRFRI